VKDVKKPLRGQSAPAMGWRFIQLIMRPRIRLNGQRYNDDPNGRNSRAP